MESQFKPDTNHVLKTCYEELQYIPERNPMFKTYAKETLERNPLFKNQADRELNYLKMNNRFEKIKPFHCMNFRQHLTFNLRGPWHTLYVMLRVAYTVCQAPISQFERSMTYSVCHAPLELWDRSVADSVCHSPSFVQWHCKPKCFQQKLQSLSNK